MPKNNQSRGKQGGAADRGQSKDNQNRGAARKTGSQSSRQAGKGGQGRGNKPSR
jgi:hypothetical protein